MRVPGVGGPRAVIGAALDRMAEEGIVVDERSRILSTAPIGPSQRRYANAAALVSSDLDPEALLSVTQDIERAFGRRRQGQRWRARPLDIDLILWSGGAYGSDGLAIPHPAFRIRPFVLRPAAEIAPLWHDPSTGRTLRQLSTRLTAPRPLPRARTSTASMPRAWALSSVGRATDF
ncbi:MAG: 2-amino-4-hydroxy-6-hydroxymethyldihydropteridine diphosphokinase [Erythrobacter sp.]|nr:2-amino-4-hydroxy-6-hydroxymethyldihydropteridine diphosphokinase [Erythrobacter sp.]